MYTPEAPFNPTRDVLRHYNEKAIDAEYVALQNYGIDDLTPLLAQLAKLTKMKHLNLSGNNLSRLPEDLSMLVSVETLDVSRNAFNDAESVVAGLYSLPHLAHLKINLPEHEENKLVATLTSVQTINGVVLDEDDLDPEEQQRKEEDLAAKVVAPPPSGYSLSAQSVKLDLNFKPWTGHDTEKFAKIYDQVGVVSGKVSLPEEYKDFSRTVMSHMRARTQQEADILKLQVHQFNAAALLLEFSFDELVRVCSRFGSDVSSAMQSIFEQHLGLIRTASVTMAVMQEDRDRRIQAVQEDLKREILLRERTQRAYEANFGATLAGGRMQYSDAEMRKGPAPYGLSQLYPATNADGEPIVNPENNGASAPGSPLRDFSDHYPSSAGGSPNAKKRGGNNIIGKGAAADGSVTKISLEELRAFLKILLKSKAESDEANAMARLPPETLEQHIYTLLVTKTSRQEVIKARVQSIYDALALYSATEVDIEIIHRVLNGELDESYVFMNVQQEGIIYDTISVATRESHEEQRRKGIPLEDYLNERQTKMVVDLVVPWPMEKRMRLVKTISAQMKRKEFEPDQYVIHAKKLAHGILKFLLTERLEEVKDVSEQFRATDRDRTGVIDINHFKHILMHLFPKMLAKKAQQLAVSADPFDNNVVNFNTAMRVVEAYKATEQQLHDASVLKSIDGKRAGIALGNGLQQQQHQQNQPQQHSTTTQASHTAGPPRPLQPSLATNGQQQQQQQQFADPAASMMVGKPQQQQQQQQFVNSRPVNPAQLPPNVDAIHYAQRSSAAPTPMSVGGGGGVGGGSAPSAGSRSTGVRSPADFGAANSVHSASRPSIHMNNTTFATHPAGGESLYDQHQSAANTTNNNNNATLAGISGIMNTPISTAQRR